MTTQIPTPKLTAELQARVNALVGSEPLKDLLILRKACEGLDVDQTNLDTYIAAYEDTVDTSTDSKNLLILSKTINNEYIRDSILKALGMEKQNYPYEFTYPNNYQEYQDMQKQADNNSIGYGGSTWWVRPCAIGRKEDGIDVVYRGSTWGSPEDRNNTALTTNKRLGEAVVSVGKLRIEDVSGTDEYTFEKRGINDRSVSYREDEHHQVMVLPNTLNGQLITAWGSRGTADGSQVVGGETIDNNRIVHIRYGQDIDTLSSSERPYGTTTVDYAQGFFTGNQAWIFTRDDIGNWSYTNATGGQNYGNFEQVFDSQGEQYYWGTAYSDPSVAGLENYEPLHRPKLHVFAQAHPTINPDRTLRYTQGTFVVAGSTTALRNGGGIYLDNPTSGLPISGNGKLGEMSLLTKDLFETAYTSPVGKSYRLLDTQYGLVPRSLIAEFDFDWVHGASVPFGTTWDLKLVQYNPNTSTWSAVTIASGLRGMLGYRPEQAAYDENIVQLSPVVQGVEGYTSAYVNGASFYRGKNHLDLAPIVYYCDRVGDDRTKHRLHRVTLDGEYTAVSTDEVVLTSSDTLYRPEMTLFGDKRILWYNAGKGWSSFNSFVAEDKFLDETLAQAAPVVEVQPVNVSGADGTDVDIELFASSVGGEQLTYQWYFKNVGDPGFTAAASTDRGFTLALGASANGREYYCDVTNSIGTVSSDTITVTVV